MKTNILLSILLIASGCSNKSVESDNGIYSYTEGRVLFMMCAGHVVQLFNSENGQDWKGISTVPFNPTDIDSVYKNCAFIKDIPKGSTPGDTLEFTYSKVQFFSGIICELGIRPDLDTLYQTKKVVNRRL